MKDLLHRLVHGLGEWGQEHPEIVAFVAIGAVVYHLSAAYNAMELYRLARERIGDIQREASEALGG